MCDCNQMLTLSRNDIKSLTALEQPAAQIRWLKRNAWPFVIGADGLPKVAMAYFERRMVQGIKDIDEEESGVIWQVNA